MAHNIDDILELVSTLQSILQKAKNTQDIVEKNILIDDAKYIAYLVSNEINLKENELDIERELRWIKFINNKFILLIHR